MKQTDPLIIELPKYTMVQRADRKNLWYVRFSYKGKQQFLCCQTQNARDGKDKAKEIIIDHIKRASKAFIAKSDESLSYASERWLLAKYRDKAPRTLPDMRSRLKVLLDALGTDLTKDLTKKLLEDTYTRLRDTRTYQPHYWKDLITAWMQLVDWLIEEELIPPLLYFRNIPVPKREDFRKVDEIISNTDLKKLLPEFSKLDQEFILVMRHTSMNPADLWELNKSHLTVDDDPKSKTGLKLVKVRAKAKSKEEVHHQPLLPVVARYLRPRWEKLKNQSDQIYGRALTEAEKATGAVEDPMYNIIHEDTAHKFTNNLSARWVVRFANVFRGEKRKKLTVLRHSFITEAILNKVTLPTLKKWVGHSPRSTEIEWTYNHHTHTADELR